MGRHSAVVPKHPKGKGCWYHTTIVECVLCGRDDIYRERRYTIKPSNPSLRLDYSQTACGCHFI